jgi:hypothetical protein
MIEHHIGSEKACKLIAGYKWVAGYRCKNCGNEKYFSGKSPSSRRCSICKKDESATAGTVFHKLRMPIDAALSIVRLCLNKKRRLSATEMLEYINTKGHAIDLKTLSDFRTKVLTYIPARITPYYIGEVILVELIYFRKPLFVIYGNTTEGVKLSCPPNEKKKKLAAVIDEYIDTDSKLATYQMNKSHHKIQFRTRKTNYREWSNTKPDGAMDELINMLNFCFDNPKGSAKFRQYCINLFFYLKHGGNFEHFMPVLTNY